MATKTTSPTGILRYPYEAITDKTDYLQITIKKNVRLGTTDTDKYIQNSAYAYSSNPASVSGISATFLKPQVLAENGVILLPMPSNIQDSNSVSYDNDSMDALSAFGAQTASTIMKDFDITKPGESAAAVTSQILKDIKEAKNSDILKVALTQLASSAVNVFGANTNLNQILARGEGTILNPNMELLFNNVTLRTFNFSFKMIPRDENESLQVKSIIRTLKKNMSAKLGTSANAEGLGRLYLHTPNIFELHYKKGNKLHPFLNRFKQCALSDMSVNYTGDNVYATYNDGTPISLILNLTFKELVPIYQEDYNDDAFTEGLDDKFDSKKLTYGINNNVQADVEGVGF